MAQIMSFPLYRREALVREIADRLQTLHGPHANAYWRERVAMVAAVLREAGVGQDKVRAEILGLQDAVQIRIRGEAASYYGE